MPYRTKPGYTADTQANITAQVPDTEDGVTCFAIAEQTLWLLSKTSVLPLSPSVIATRSGTGRWLRIAYSGSTAVWSPETTQAAGPATVTTLGLNIIVAGIFSAGNFTVGQLYSCYGVTKRTSGFKFYHQSAGGPRTIRVKLWFNGVLNTSVDVAVNASGIYTGSWAAPVTLTNGPWALTCWETTGTSYTRTSRPGMIPLAYPVFPGIMAGATCYAAGDAYPNVNTGGGEYYPVDLVMEPLCRTFPRLPSKPLAFSRPSGSSSASWSHPAPRSTALVSET